MKTKESTIVNFIVNEKLIKIRKIYEKKDHEYYLAIIKLNENISLEMNRDWLHYETDEMVNAGFGKEQQQTIYLEKENIYKEITGEELIKILKECNIEFEEWSCESKN